jgi:cell division protein ZapA (FtsZ GTPase activity inhibitor)
LDKQSVKLTLFGRHFTVLVQPNEVSAVHEAAKQINDRIKQFRLDFNTRDELDIALMVSLGFANELIQKNQAVTEVPLELSNRLTALESKLDIAHYLGDET